MIVYLAMCCCFIVLLVLMHYSSLFSDATGVHDTDAYLVALYSLKESPGLKALRSRTFSSEYDVSSIQKRMKQNNMYGVVRGSCDYPHACSSIDNPPYVLYVRGAIEVLQSSCLSVVGPRMYTSYAERVTQECIQKMKGSGRVIVSGMASGIDTIAHKSAIANNLPTVAVLGEGIGRALQGSKRHMLQSIVDKGGLVLSEFPLFMRARSYTFPQRNRIIAGLGEALFVPEAAEKSGTMITVSSAIKQGVPVYATPHTIYRESSRGIMNHIAQGNVRMIADLSLFVHKTLGISTHVSKNYSAPVSSLSTSSQRVLSMIQKSPEAMSVQLLSESLEYNSAQILRELSQLELSGYVRCNSQGLWECC